METDEFDLNGLLDEYRGTPEWAALERRRKLAAFLTSWMKHIPVVGSVVHAFWYCLIDEGIYQTCKPRWGALTFSFLNDGMRPTVWHTWRQITHGQDDPFTGIYVDGAPRSYAEAVEREAKYAAQRLK